MDKLYIKCNTIIKEGNEIEQLSGKLTSIESRLKAVKSNLSGLGKYGDVASAMTNIITEINKEAQCIKQMGSKLNEIGHLYQDTDEEIAETSIENDGGEKSRYSGELRDALQNKRIRGMSEQFIKTTNNIVERDVPEGYILVDNMDYIPMNDELQKRLYENDTGEVDRNGNPIYGLANLHNSATAPTDFDAIEIGLKYVSVASLSQFLTSGDLLLNFLNGNGEDYYYNASSLLINGRVRENYEDNLENMARISEECLKDNETLIIANSQSNALPGCQSFLDEDGNLAQLAKCVTNANAFASINSADAGIVCEVSRDGDHYSMTYNYYIIDYYDFDKNVLEELYDLNRYGYANNFLGFGKISGTIEWDAGEEMDF